MAALSQRLRGWNAFALAAGTAIVATVAFMAILGFQPGGEKVAIAVDDIGEALAALAAAGACAWTARRSEGKLRRGWALLAASAAAWGIGEIIWSVYDVPASRPIGRHGFPRRPLAIAERLLPTPRGTAEHWRLWLDGLTIALAPPSPLGLLAQQIELSPGSLSERASGRATGGRHPHRHDPHPAIRRATRFHHGDAPALVRGLLNAIADSIFAYMTAMGNYPTL
jgi:hypothetical protein